VFYPCNHVHLLLLQVILLLGHPQQLNELFLGVDSAHFLTQKSVQYQRNGEGKWKSEQHEEFGQTNGVSSHSQTMSENR